MKVRHFLILSLALGLAACNSNDNKDYLPEYLKPDSPLDPPGTAEARAAMRAKILKEGKYPTDAEAPVLEGKVFLLDHNPDRNEAADGRLVKTPSVKVIACEGTYYFVETQDGERGYVRESDLENPVTLVSNSPIDLLGGAAALPQDGSMPVQLDETHRLQTSTTGRSVILTNKQSERGAEFERRRQEMLQGQEGGEALPQPSGSGQKAGGDDYEPLPEPAGGGELQ